MTKSEKEAYECFLDRLAAPSGAVSIPKEENVKYNKEHPLPSQEEIKRVLREAGYYA